MPKQLLKAQEMEGGRTEKDPYTPLGTMRLQQLGKQIPLIFGH